MSDAWLLPALLGGGLGCLVTLALGGLRRTTSLLAGQAAMPGLSPLTRLGDIAPPPPTALDALKPAGGETDIPARALGTLIESLAAPIVILDSGFGVRFTNAPARALLGDTVGAVLRHPAIRAAAGRLEPGTAAMTELALDVPVERSLRAALMPLSAPFSRDGLFSIVFDDRSETLAIEKMRADFVANASHELRTPLASLIGFIDTLRGPAADDAQAQKRFLEIMAGQAARMRRLIDNLLSLSRVQMVEHERPRQRLDLGPLLHRVAAELAPLFEARAQTLRVSVASSLPQVAGDADQIVQVLQNLLENAAKYGAEGGRVDLRLRHGATGALVDDDPLWSSHPGVVVSVRDDGPGIAARHIPRLTERFYRAEENQAGKSGSGLGLAIVKHIVGRHRGRLAIESEPGAGALFSVWLPAVD